MLRDHSPEVLAGVREWTLRRDNLRVALLERPIDEVCIDIGLNVLRVPLVFLIWTLNKLDSRVLKR